MEAKSKISILEEDGRKIDERSKSFLWSILKRKWNIPDDDVDLTKKIRNYTMKIANTAWRTFKKNLISFSWIREKVHVQDISLSLRIRGENSVAASRLLKSRKKEKKGKTLVNRNKNPHHLGSGGYSGAKPKWAKAMADGKLFEVQGILSERTQNWIMARLPKAGPDDYVIPENIQEITNQIKERERRRQSRDHGFLK